MATLMTPQEAEEFVVSTNRYNRTRPRTPTTTLASFTYSDDREVTIELKSKRPQIWLDDGNWLSEDVKALFSNGIVFYEAGAPRQSNIKKINGHKAMARIKVPTLDLLAQLLAAYEGTDRREPYGPRRRTPPGETGPVLKAGRATLGKKATASLKLRAYFDEYAGEGNTQGYGGGKRTVEHGAIVTQQSEI
jgi:ribosomal protein S16